jgi:hypothetical protein
VKTSLIWRRTEEGNVICLDCYTAQKKNEKQPSNDVTGGTPPPPPPTPSSSSTTVTTRRRKGGRKGGRGGIDKSSSTASTSQPVQQKGRRSLIKGKPIKAPVSEPHLSTSDSVIYKGIVYEVGDVVSVLDHSGGIYYALIRGFLVDQYAEKFAVLTWVLPRTPNPENFDPSNFILGPDDDEPRNLQLLDFVCHSPNSKSFSSHFSHNLDMSTKWIP